jgi:hypothetical protein
MSARSDGSVSATPWSALADRPKRLRDLAIVTHCVPNLDAVVEAWTRWFGFMASDRGTVGRDLAGGWDTPAVAGRRFALLQPASGEACWLRFVETDVSGGHGPPLTCGWIATELLATDPDALARELRGSPFRVLGGPADLFPRPKAPRAMQLVGPAGELIYCTRILPGGSRYGLKGARSAVDRPFIVTVGGRSTTSMLEFYGETLGQRVLDTMPFTNSILAAGCGVPWQTVIPTSVVRIPGRRFLVETDELPARVGPRPRPAGGLPAGMSMVSFIVDSLDDFPAALRAEPRRIAQAPYAGRRVGVSVGAAGEWLELIEGEAA